MAGESYAGHYVPAVSNRVYKYNQAVAPEKRINLKGIAIGDGYTNPGIQYGAYADYALMMNLIGKSVHDVIRAVSSCRLVPWWLMAYPDGCRSCNPHAVQATLQPWDACVAYLHGRASHC